MQIINRNSEKASELSFLCEDQQDAITLWRLYSAFRGFPVLINQVQWEIDNLTLRVNSQDGFPEIEFVLRADDPGEAFPSELTSSKSLTKIEFEEALKSGVEFVGLDE